MTGFLTSHITTCKLKMSESKRPLSLLKTSGAIQNCVPAWQRDNWPKGGWRWVNFTAKTLLSAGCLAKVRPKTRFGRKAQDKTTHSTTHELAQLSPVTRPSGTLCRKYMSRTRPSGNICTSCKPHNTPGRLTTFKELTRVIAS